MMISRMPDKAGPMVLNKKPGIGKFRVGWPVFF